MDNLGKDAVELCNEHQMKLYMVDLAFKQLPSILKNVHAKGFSHGDIKLENIVFRDDQWSYIDFGLGSITSTKDLKLFGTFPLILPAFGNHKSLRTFREVSTIPIYVAADVYALALTFLALIGLNYTVNGFANTIDLDTVRELHQHGTSKDLIYPIPDMEVSTKRELMIKCCAEIVLSQCEHDSNKLIWYSNTKRCVFYSSFYKNYNAVIETDIGKLWLQMQEISTNLF
jgi:serine/threonine protein kinase